MQAAPPAAAGRDPMDFARFSLSRMIECGAALRRLGEGARAMEDVAERAVGWLHDRFEDPETGARCCPLVRFYTTRPLAELEPDVRLLARRLAPGAPEGTRCLTLLATRGALRPWNSRRRSRRHQVIPLPSAAEVERLPMVSQLLRQLGLEAEELISPDPRLLLDLSERTYNVFHVPEVLGSPWVPDQEDFVRRFGVRSALGFGGVLPFGDLFAVVLFSRAPIPRPSAERFRTLALHLKVALLPFAGGPVFRAPGC